MSQLYRPASHELLCPWCGRDIEITVELTGGRSNAREFRGTAECGHCNAWITVAAREQPERKLKPQFIESRAQG